jgi:hypothetical protein
MPISQCSNGMFRIGTGECKFATKEDAEKAFKAMNHFAETFDDYPEEAVNNAKRAIKYKEEKGSDCGTLIGWRRARSLANKEPVSLDVVRRMAAFIRHEQNKSTPYSEGCGGIMWDAWGGDAGIKWAIAKIKQLRK